MVARLLNVSAPKPLRWRRDAGDRVAHRVPDRHRFRQRAGERDQDPVRDARERFVDQLPVQILPCPVPFPRLMYYQLWHERTHASSAARWLREQIKSVAAALRRPESESAAA